MSRLALGVSAVAVLGLLALVLPASEKKPEPAQSSASDAKEIAKLRAKVKALELRVDALEKRSPQLSRTDTDARARLLQEWIQTQRQQTVPEGQAVDEAVAVEALKELGRFPTAWGQGEINGITYYIIPLSASQNGGPQTAATTQTGVLQEAPAVPAPKAAR